MTKAQQLAAELHAKQLALNEFAGNGKSDNFTTEQIEQFQQMNAEVNEIAAKYEAQRDIEAAVQRNADAVKQFNAPTNALPVEGNDGDAQREIKSIGELFTESQEFQREFKLNNGNFAPNADFIVPVNGAAFKTTMTTAAGFAPANNRGPVVVLSAQNRPRLLDFIPQSTTRETAIKYMVESTYTSNMAAAAEASAGGESAFAFTETTANVEYIKGYLPISERQLSSVPGIQSLINDRLMLQWQQKAEYYALNGSGTTPEIRGFYNATNLQTYAKAGGQNDPDAIYEAITLIRTTAYSEPDLIVIHPNDWKDIRLMKTSNGEYIWGNPAEEAAARIWGIPVLATTAATEGTPLVGCFREHSHISVYEAAMIAVGRINDDLIKNKLTVTVAGQMSLEIYRGAAFCQVTGL